MFSHFCCNHFFTSYLFRVLKLFMISVPTCPLFGRTVLDLRVLSSVLSLIGRKGEKSSFLQTKNKNDIFSEFFNFENCISD